MRYESTMMMAGPTTIAAPRMDQPHPQPTGVLYNPPSIPQTSSSATTTTRRPSLPHHPSSGLSSSQQQPHRRGSTATTSSRHRSSQHHYQHQQQQQQPQFLFYPQIIPYQQMPYHQQLPYQHQRMHNLLHGSVNSYQPLPYNNPYQAVHQGQTQNQNQNQPSRSQSSLSLNHRRPSHPPSRPSQLSLSQQRPSQNHHLRRPHLLPPHAPPSSQQHSSSSSFSSQQQLAKQAQAQATSQVKAKTEPKEESVAPTTTTMPLFAGFSLRGSKQNKMARADKKEETEKKKATTTTKTTTVLSASIKPPVRKSDPVGRNRGPVDAKDLAQRLQTILAERGMQQSAAGTGGSVPPSPLGEGPPPVQNGGRRIRSRGSGNLRAVYASNAPVVPTTNGGESIRRQPFSAPHSLSAYKAATANNTANAGLGLVPPPTMDELQRRKNRTRSQSQSPQQAQQQVNMRGGGLSSSGGGLTLSNTQDTLAQRRAVTSVIPPTNAHHGVPYIPSQAAQQFQRTTHSVGGPRKSILLQKPRSPKEPYAHNQSVAKSPALSQKGSQKGEKPSPTMSAKSPVTPSSARAPSVKHAFKDTLAEPGSRRQSMKEGEAANQEAAVEAADDKADLAVEEAGDEADDEATADAETDLEADKAKAAKAAATAKKPVAASDFRRIVQEHSVDWTQSDETSIQRKREKKEKKEREKREKKAKQQQAQNEAGVAAAGDEMQSRPMWRLKARLSSFSKDKRSPSPPAAAATTTASVPEEDKTETSTVPEEGTSATVEEPKAESKAETKAEPTSNSSSVLSLTAMKKSSSFLALFKH